MNDEQLKYYLLGILGLVIVSGMAIARLYGVVGGLDDGEIPYGKSGYKVAFLEEDGVQGIIDAQDSRLKLDDSLRFADLPTIREAQQQYADAVETNTANDLAMSDSLDSNSGNPGSDLQESTATNTTPNTDQPAITSNEQPSALPIETASVTQPEPSITEVSTSTSSAPASVEQPAAASAGEAEAKPEPKWWVQLGTFGIRENALRVYDKTASAGYKTVIDQIQRNGRTLHVVRIPTNGDRKQAAQLVNSIHEEFGFDAIVVRF